MSHFLLQLEGSFTHRIYVCASEGVFSCPSGECFIKQCPTHSTSRKETLLKVVIAAFTASQRTLGTGKKEWAYKRKCNIVFELRDRRDVASVCSDPKRICFHPGRACQHESAGTQQKQLPSPSWGHLWAVGSKVPAHFGEDRTKNARQHLVQVKSPMVTQQCCALFWGCPTFLEGVVPRQWDCLSWAGGWRNCFWELQGSKEHAGAMQSGSTVSIPSLAHAICHSSVGHLGIGGVMTRVGGFSSWEIRIKAASLGGRRYTVINTSHSVFPLFNLLVQAYLTMPWRSQKERPARGVHPKRGVPLILTLYLKTQDEIFSSSSCWVGPLLLTKHRTDPIWS